MYYTYILKSLENNKYYIGSTDNLNKRLVVEHNTGKVTFTKLYRPWEIYHFEKYLTRTQAFRREKQIKAWKSRYMIEKLKFK